MRRTRAFVLSVSLCFTALRAHNQQPVISVKSFEYIWEKTGMTFSSEKSRLIVASEDSAKRYIKNAFAGALKQRWNLEIPDLPLSVKQLGVFASAPKFNTRIKEKQPGTWYLFLQIFDQRPLSLVSPDNPDRRVSVLELKCLLIDAYRDSTILDRTFVTEIYEQPPPPEQSVLLKFPGYPAYFLHAIDSIAKWLFQPEEPGEKLIRLKPACVFTGLPPPSGWISELSFNGRRDSIRHITEPSFLFRTPRPVYKKTDAKHNRGGNTAGGALTLFTGVNFNKSKVYEYVADFTFEEPESIFHCVVNYAERETAERNREKTKNPDGSKSYSVTSGSYELAERRVISDAVNAITVANDTIATFQFASLSRSKERSNYTQFWDGTDSATITPFPVEWNHVSYEDNVTIKGQMGNLAFSMNTAKGMSTKEFYVDSTLIMIMYGYPSPVRALLFRPVTAMQLKMFTMLASLPYPDFNYTAY